MRVPSLKLIPLLAAAAALAGPPAGAQVSLQTAEPRPLEIETVPVESAGNPDDIHGYGAVDYSYDIGKYEITTAQYAAFLNAVAKTDTCRLYNASMWSSDTGCGIERVGFPGRYGYRVTPDRAQRPVNFVSWGDAARFANWLHNGQPTGQQDLTTTEDGAYFLNGVTSDSQLEPITREPDARWAIPSEDEWYKAAYHKNDGPTANYFSYPTASDASPSNDLIDPDPGNNATRYRNIGDYTIGPPHYRTPVGAHENTTSPCGAFDMAGNVLEWNEVMIDRFSRGVRGGSWYWGGLLRSAERPYEYYSPDEFDDLGFRVVRLR